jgi:hypothetical protein
MLSLSFSPLIPEVAIWALAGIAALLVALAFVSRGPVAILRAAALLVVLGALANPSLLEERDPVRTSWRSSRPLIAGAGDRPEMDAVRASSSAASRCPVETRFIEAATARATMAPACSRPFARPRRRAADRSPASHGTDGVVHDIPPAPSASADRSTPS